MLLFYYVLKIFSIFLIVSQTLVHTLGALSESEKIAIASAENIEAKALEIKENFLSYTVKSKTIDPSIRIWRSENPDSSTNIVTYCLYNHQETALQTVNDIVKQTCACNSSLAWWITPQTRPVNMANVLKSYGFSCVGNFPAMLCFLDEFQAVSAHSDIFVKQLTILDEAAAWTMILGQSFNWSAALIHCYKQAIEQAYTRKHANVERYAAYYKGELAGTGELYIGDTWAGIRNITTHQVFRNKGIATQLTSSLLERARAQALEYVVLVSAPAAEVIYSRLGFKRIFDIAIYRFCSLTA